jgi:hypothetical protein
MCEVPSPVLKQRDLNKSVTQGSTMKVRHESRVMICQVLVAQACNLATWEAEIGQITIQDQPKQKVSKTLISTHGWAHWHVPVISAISGSVNLRLVVQAKSATLSPK